MRFEIQGFLAKDPEMKYFESGAVKTTISIPESKGKEHPTIWRYLEAWGSIAEIVGELHKGDRIKCTGYTTVDSYTKDGEEIVKDTYRLETIGKIDKKDA